VRNDLSLEEKTEGGLTEAVYELKMSGDWGESANPTTQAIATVSALAEDGDSAMGEALNEKRSSNIFQWARAALDLALSQWLLLSMGLVIALAYRFPSVGKSGGYIASQWTVTYGAVSLIFLVSGLSLSFDQLVKHTRNVRLHLIVQVMSFLVTSSIFFGVACAARTNQHIDVSTLVGLIATGALPTTISSNVVMTKQAGGDEAATVVAVTVGNFLGPFITPLLITKLYLPASAEFREWLPSEATDNLPQLYRNVMLQMGTSVFAPFATGQVFRAIWPNQIQWGIRKFNLGKIGSLCVLTLVWWVTILPQHR
jgi:sodium/bile acid cotransporter 7